MDQLELITNQWQLKKDDHGYFYATDPKSILFDYMNFNHFRDILMIQRTFNAYQSSNPLTMSVEIDSSNIFNSENDNSGDDSQVTYIYNFLSSDNMLMENIVIWTWLYQLKIDKKSILDNG